MAISNKPIFLQKPKSFAAKITDANTNLDGSGTITTLYTAPAEGAVVVDLAARCQATVTATACRLFKSRDAGVTWEMIDEKLMAAYTVTQTTAQTAVSFASRTSPLSGIELGPNEVLGATIGVALAGGIVFSGWAREYVAA